MHDHLTISQPRHWRDDDIVVQFPVRSGIELPRYCDDVWDLKALDSAEHRSASSLYFDGLSGWRKQLAKELMATRLNIPTFSSRRNRVVKRYASNTCEAMLGALKRVFVYMDEHSIKTLKDLKQSDLDAFHVQLQEAKHAEMYIASQLQIFVWLWESRDELTAGGLCFDPWAGRSTIEIAGYVKPSETKTPRIPPKIVGALLRWALAYVDHFSEDIIAAMEAYVPSGERWYDSSDQMERRFASYVAKLRQDGRKLPGVVHIGELKPCRQLIGKDADVSPRWFSNPKGAEALARAEEELGGVEPTNLRRPAHVIKGQIAPWRETLTIEEMKQECRHLMAAAYVVCAYLSGMRDAEVQHMRRGCVQVERDERGIAVRYRVRALTFKGKKKGKMRTWIVIEPVARAIKVLERLTAEFHRETKDPHLFVRLHYGSKANYLIKGQINAVLQAFAEHCNGYLAARLEPPTNQNPKGKVALGPIPTNSATNGPWHFTSSQFRKTLAWHIANQPFGEIAGMIQYGHASIQMFEAYAGTPEAGFFAEVLQAQEKANLATLMEMQEDFHAGILPAGPMAQELIELFKFASRRIGPFPGERADELRVGQHLRNKARQLHVGVYSHCFFVPSRAECLKHLDPEERRQPVTGLCATNCGNACRTWTHLPALEGALAESEIFAGSNRLPPGQREVLRRDQRALVHMIDEIKDATGV